MLSAMCGRFTQHMSWQEIVEAYRLFDGIPAINLRPNYNVSPTHDVLTIRDEDGLTPQLMRWGLVPFWAKDLKIGYKLINARGETAAEKPSFRAAFKKRRCIIPADGFFEWKREGTEKQPHYIKRADGAPMSFAGLWEHWDKAEEPVTSFTIVTTEPNQFMKSIHNRMPVILDAPQAWLDGAGEELLTPYGGELISHPVSKDVGSPKNNHAQLLEPLMGPVI